MTLSDVENSANCTPIPKRPRMEAANQAVAGSTKRKLRGLLSSVYM